MIYIDAKQGDVLRRRKGPVWHRGYYLGDGSVLHITPEMGIHISNVEDFGAGREIFIETQPPAVQSITMRRALEELYEQKSYNYWSNNCEHMIHRILYGKHKSETVSFVASAILVAVLIAWTRSYAR